MKNKNRWNLPLGFIIIAVLIWFITPQVKAGGWAVITLDQLPESPVANQSFEINFMVRQHGQRPMADLKPTVTLTHFNSQETLEVAAYSQVEIGRYGATLNLPYPGKWYWSIRAFSMKVEMPDLQVRAESSNNDGINSKEDWSIWLGMAGLVGLLGSVALWWRKRVWWTSLLLIITGLIGTTGMVMTLNNRTVPETNPALANQSNLGAELYIAKGCITCHQHAGIETDNVSINTGPNLTHFTTSPEYLQLWLEDPAAVKPNTLMPNLNLSDSEIETLITVLASPSTQASN